MYLTLLADLMYGVYSPCVKQYAFCQGGLAGIDVS